MSGDKLRDRKAASIAEDEDNPEWTEADFARARPAGVILPADVAARLVRGRGRPAKAPGERKQRVTLRLAPDLLEAARASGRGWQTRAEEALRREFLGDPVAPRAPHVGRMVSMHQTMKEAVEAVKAGKAVKLSKSFKIGGDVRPGRLIRGKAAKSDGGKKRA